MLTMKATALVLASLTLLYTIQCGYMLGPVFFPELPQTNCASVILSPGDTPVTLCLPGPEGGFEEFIPVDGSEIATSVVLIFIDQDGNAQVVNGTRIQFNGITGRIISTSS